MNHQETLVSWERTGDVALIQMHKPPVNALGVALRRELLQAITEAASDQEVRVLVISGLSKAFSAGADIKELGAALNSPSLRDIIVTLDNIPKLIVAAIQGVALGGGLELALACHARVAWQGAKLGLPEVKLGLVPGAGGTQRLPRLVGFEKAAQMIMSGEPVDAGEAERIGLVDAVLDGSYPEATIAWAGKQAPMRRVRDREECVEEARKNPEQLDRTANKLLKNTGPEAPRACFRSVRAAVEMPFDQGLANERLIFEAMMENDESLAQRYAFVAERQAQSVAAVKGTSEFPIRTAAVIGAGTMGAGIAMCFASAGIPVTLVEVKQAALDSGLERISALYAGSVSRGSLTAAEAASRTSLIQRQIGLKGTATQAADIVIEAVFEDMNVKKDVFRELENCIRPDCILATNTSYLDIDEIARATRNPERVLGMHFFSPANVMRLLEVVRGEKTSAEMVSAAAALGKKLGKISVVVGNCFGFVGNRMHARRNEACERLLLDGAFPYQIDDAMTAFGFRMGPFAAADLAGLDIGWRMRRMFKKPVLIADELCELGYFGQKAGRGFYTYTGGRKNRDSEVENLIIERSVRTGVSRQQISDEEIVKRVVYPMINEGMKILEDGIADNASVIDAIWINGFGWPRWKGGPMWYADHVGLKEIHDRLLEFAQLQDDESLKPAKQLSRLSAEGKLVTNHVAGQ